MPSLLKTLSFTSGFVLSIGSFAVICTCLGTQEWVTSSVHFKGANYSGYAYIRYGLFQARHEKKVTEGVGLDQQPANFQVFEKLTGNDAQKIIHILIILFLVSGLLFSFMGSVTTCLNIVSNPYLTYLGPIGVYIWTSINGICILLAMILFASNTELNGMPKYLAEIIDNSDDKYFETRNTYGYSYWLLLLSLFLNIGTIGVIYYYQHARYSKQKEQERPLENASKDVILF
ncbi:clarin-3 [Spea bombifrons]|uniref:clarin-3 n=1 Tax=Spea bombifrons TaxID=233779 RepID=UPI00234AFE94|nr:clarin-3 [Spea bombifrons]